MRRLGDRPLGKRYDNRQVLTGAKTAGRHEAGSWIVRRHHAAAVVGPFVAPAPGVGLQRTRRPGPVGQRHHRFNFLDRERPLRTVDVPVEFIVVFEVADLPRRFVFERVSVDAVLEHHVFPAAVNARVVRLAVEMVRFSLPVAFDAQNFKTVALIIPDGGLARREVAIDPALDFPALDPDGDGLRDRQGRIRIHHNVTAKQ